MRPVTNCLPFAFALAAGACHGGGDPGLPFPATPYEGRVEVLVSPPGGTAYDEHGKGTARFTPDGSGGTQLSVIGAIVDPRGDAGLEVDGKATGNGGWSGGMGDLRVDIDPHGRITGGGVAPPQAFTITGDVSPSSFDLVVVIELLEANAGGLPRGTQMRFTYDLAQPGAAPALASPTRGRRADMKDCRKVEYEVRPVPDPGGGTLVMRRMPVCRD
ncbi:hypothetical protein WCE37_07380 [Luteimonas sp. MJ250]|uniref:hypothetical protein n=1 Tax=Luteimonas sp. MJ250 TaxID=3129236 RepID=UPI0031BBB7A4